MSQNKDQAWLRCSNCESVWLGFPALFDEGEPCYYCNATGTVALAEDMPQPDKDSCPLATKGVKPMTRCPDCDADLTQPEAIAANASARDWYHCGRDSLGQPDLLEDRHQHIGHSGLWCTKCEAYLDIHSLCPWP